MVKFVEIIFWQNLLTILLSKGHLKNHLTSCILYLAMQTVQTLIVDR